LKELLAQNNATYQQISPMEEIAYKEAHRLMSDRSSSHAMSPVNQHLVGTRPSSYRTTTAGDHPKYGHYAPSEQSSSYATTPVNKQLGMWQPQSCGRFSSSDIYNAYYVPPHAHGQYVNYQQFQCGNSQPWMSFGSEQPNISRGGYPQLDRPASNNPLLVNPYASSQSIHFHYHHNTHAKQEQEERYNGQLGRAIDAIVKLENQLTNNPEVLQLLHASFSHWNDPANCSKHIWLPQKKIAKLTPD
jgi:hypothetical protein